MLRPGPLLNSDLYCQQLTKFKQAIDQKRKDGMFHKKKPSDVQIFNDAPKAPRDWMKVLISPAQTIYFIQYFDYCKRYRFSLDFYKVCIICVHYTFYQRIVKHRIKIHIWKCFTKRVVFTALKFIAVDP